MLLKDTWGIKENGDAHEDDEKMEDGEGEVKEKEPKEVEAAEIKDEKDEKAEAKDAKVTEPNGTATTIDDEDEEVTCVLSNKLKLRCPLSFERVDIPVRGETCMWGWPVAAVRLLSAMRGFIIFVLFWLTHGICSVSLDECNPQDSSFIQMQMNLMESIDPEKVETVEKEASGKTEEKEAEKAPKNGTNSSEGENKTLKKVAATTYRLEQNADPDAVVVTVDERNFTQLKDDLSYAGENLASAKVLSDVFEKAVIRTTLAQKEVLKAEAEREEILKQIQKLLNKTIATEAVSQKDLIQELKTFNSSNLASQTASAAESAANAAKLAEDLAAAEARIVEAVLIRDEAMKKQAAAVQQIQEKLRSSIMVEMNDTRLVQILDASDRIKSVPYMLTTTTTTTVNQKLPIQDILDRLDVTVNIEKADKELANETKYEEGEVLYPTDWAVIGALILVIVFVTAVVCYSRNS
eukprot:symbB.v1.2.004787.t1/scaffold274.1/size244435/28